jgi:hypothetical protein
MPAARNSKFRTKLNALLTEKRVEVVGFIEYFYLRVGIAAPIPPKRDGHGLHEPVRRGEAVRGGPARRQVTPVGVRQFGLTESNLSIHIRSVQCQRGVTGSQRQC